MNDDDKGINARYLQELRELDKKQEGERQELEDRRIRVIVGINHNKPIKVVHSTYHEEYETKEDIRSRSCDRYEIYVGNARLKTINGRLHEAWEFVNSTFAQSKMLAAEQHLEFKKKELETAQRELEEAKLATRGYMVLVEEVEER